MRTAEDEILQVMAEECNEVAIEVSKVLRFGLENQYANVTNKDRLTKEVGDLICMVELLIERDLIHGDEISKYSLEKRAKLKQWSPIIFEGDEE